MTERAKASVVPVIVGVALTAAIGIGVNATAMGFDHETRLTVLEKAEYVKKADLLEMEARLKDCLNHIQQNRLCD